MARLAKALIAAVVASAAVVSGVALGSPSVLAETAARATLAAEATSAPVGTEVPITVTVTPRSVADVSTPRGRVVRVQVRNQVGTWVTIDSYRLPRSGVLRASVTGIVPGYTGQYRAVVMRLNNTRPLVTSNVVGIFWLNPDGSVPPTPEPAP